MPSSSVFGKADSDSLQPVLNMPGRFAQLPHFVLTVYVVAEVDRGA